MHHFEKLNFWKKSIELAKKIYLVSTEISSDEKFGLISQMKRASVSIPSNIAEGYGRNTDKSFSHFLDIARGSLFEIETQLIIAKELGFITNLELFQELLNQIEEESKMINAFSKTLKANH